MRVVFQMSAIVAALALAGCGQRGALYLPVVPPLPPKPVLETQPGLQPDAFDTAPSAASDAGTSGTSLQLSPALSAPAPASAANPTR
ncbi:LPS translocon maturation chaperone LptM [Burkholderia sp. 22PA0106]|uniref:LPS translocon maturation chaperone LptM n=1 Tax=Burkholderia sp. 22PA0106 TaxID=3237371 RepID=UPI0039C41E5E